MSTEESADARSNQQRMHDAHMTWLDEQTKGDDAMKLNVPDSQQTPTTKDPFATTLTIVLGLATVLLTAVLVWSITWMARDGWVAFWALLSTNLLSIAATIWLRRTTPANRPVPFDRMA